VSDTNGSDSTRHWDGTQWLAWNGSEWLPEALPATAVDPAGAVAPPTGLRNRRPVLIVTGLVVVIAIAAGIYFGTRGKDSSGSSGSSDEGGITSSVAYPTRAATCTIEMNVAVDITVNHDASLYNVIGTSSPLFNLSTQALIKFESLMSQIGGNEAEKQIIPTLQSLCSQAGNPVLTQSQVSGMAAVAEPGDASSLNEVTLFASGTNGK